jgi:hypothetical protein
LSGDSEDRQPNESEAIDGILINYYLGDQAGPTMGLPFTAPNPNDATAVGDH